MARQVRVPAGRGADAQQARILQRPAIRGDQDRRGDQRQIRRRRLSSPSSCRSATTTRTRCIELFRAADICVVSSLHDGMNLVAKEFIAARDDEQGVLLLSSFAGASRELAEAMIVNPYDSHGMADALDCGAAHVAGRSARAHPRDARSRAPAQRPSVGGADAAGRFAPTPPCGGRGNGLSELRRCRPEWRR